MDRQKIENDLRNSGFTDMQSEALSYLFAEMATKDDIREMRAELRTMRAELHAAIAESGKQTMDAIVAFQNKLFTHVLVLIGALTAIVTLVEFLMR